MGHKLLYNNTLVGWRAGGAPQLWPLRVGQIVMTAAKNIQVEVEMMAKDGGHPRCIGWTVLETVAYIQRCVLGGSFIEPTPVKPGPALSSHVTP
jgi:hypothetical protein